MTTEADVKRPGGQTTVLREALFGLPAGERVWLVLAESEPLRAAGWRHVCGTDVLSQTVYHPIHDGPFPLSGSGRVHTEQVPYCPRCETEPNWQGTPIRIVAP